MLTLLYPYVNIYLHLYKCKWVEIKEENRMFCEKCGKELFDEAVICPNCGCPTSNYLKNQNQQQYGNINLTTAKAWCMTSTIVGIIISTVGAIGFLLSAVYMFAVISILGWIFGMICGIVGINKANRILALNHDDREARSCKNWGRASTLLPLLPVLAFIIIEILMGLNIKNRINEATHLATAAANAMIGYMYL